MVILQLLLYCKSQSYVTVLLQGNFVVVGKNAILFDGVLCGCGTGSEGTVLRFN